VHSSEDLGLTTDEFYEALLDDNPLDLYENAPCGYLSTSPDGSIVKVNQTFLAWTGFDRSALVGRRRLADLLTAGGRIFYETHIAPMLRMQDKAREIAVEIRCADGRRLPVLLNAVLRRDADGNPMAVRVAVFDATERRAYERELLEERRRAEASEARARQLARTLQASLIPPALPQVPHLELFGAYRAAGDGSEVGGDFYDVFEAGDGSLIVTIGDVCGKGVEAAVVTSLARHTIRAATYGRQSPVEVLRTLNDVLLRESPDRFCTVAYLRIEPGPGSADVTSVCAGHPPPVVADRERAVEIGKPGTALGIVADVRLQPVESTFAAGSLLAVFTDGCTEARDPDGDFFGEEALHDALRDVARAVPDDPAAAICDTVLAFQQGTPREEVANLVAPPLA
jgi:sigma-B regulation protein RsbU (phosphoserine phosphatase)